MHTRSLKAYIVQQASGPKENQFDMKEGYKGTKRIILCVLYPRHILLIE